MSAAQGLQLEYVAAAPAREGSRDTVGAVLYGTAAGEAGAALPAQVPQVAVRMPVLPSGGPVLERWHAGPGVRYGQVGTVRLAQTADLLFGALEAAEGAEASARSGLEAATEWAYRQIHAALEASGHAHLVRVWNYLPRINTATRGLERYRQFNIARQRALLACGREVHGNVPAASALGSQDGPLVIYFLAARAAPRFLENPRQMSAYHYPPEYGERAPSFSRATLIERAGRPLLFLSGTSSIVGHRTLHAGDAAAQTRETLTNIEALLEAAGVFGLEELAYKIYVRRAQDLAEVRREIDAALGAQPQRVYLQADVCRADLTVEIEATGGCGGP
jgi:chorismate lyase/3-hydroxybenzoate synthase